MCAFEFTGLSSGPRRRQRHQDEWIYVFEGELVFAVGEKQFQASPGESVFCAAPDSLCMGIEQWMAG